MKHVFLLNPMAGKADTTAMIREKLKAYDGKIDYETHVTAAPGEAPEFIRTWCREHPGEEVRFYACGGDGTANEVANGIYGQENASFTIYPCGSGNDFVKYYGGKDAFLDLDRLISGTEVTIDAISVDGRIAVNVVNFGFDSCVCRTMIRVKRIPVLGGKHAYTTGIVHAIFHALRNRCTMEADEETMIERECLMCTVANGQYVGGAYRCAPKSKNDDGLLDVTVIRPIGLTRIPGFIGPYTDGSFLDDERFRDLVIYRRAKSVRVRAEGGIWIVVDGEMVRVDDAKIEILPGALRFSVPAEA